MGQQAVSVEELERGWIDFVVGSQICDRKPHILWWAGGGGLELTFEERNGRKAQFSPSTSWGDAGPIIEQFKISLSYDAESGWTAAVRGGESRTDFHPLQAAMRALIASKIKGECYIPTYK